MSPIMSYAEVADTLEAFVNGTGGQWDWDNYISATLFDDPYLQEVQRRMIYLSDEYPAPKGQGYCSPDGLAVIKRYVVDLRRRASQTS